jgi:60 kDa SS-A/Ro ribonucleoprotein
VAALFAVAILRRNKEARVFAFDCEHSYWGGRRTKDGQVTGGLYEPNLNPYDSVMTLAGKLATYGGGGTDCSIPLRYLNQTGYKADSIIMVSDNQSWSGPHGGHAGMAQAWTKFKGRNRNAKLVNLDIQPYPTTQVPDAKREVLNIGGFSDAVFTIMGDFLGREVDTNFVSIVENYADF